MGLVTENALQASPKRPGLVAVVLAPLEDDVRRQPVLVPLQREEARHVLRHRRPRVP